MTSALRLAAVAIAGAALMTGCVTGGREDSRGGSRPSSAAGPAAAPLKAGNMRSTIGGLLRQAGHTTDADLVASPESTLTRLDTPFLSTWRIVQVDYRAPAHPVLLHLAVGGSQAYRLTGDPMAFNRMTAADGTRVTDPQTAVRLVRMFLETTRPAGELTYLVEGVDDIRFRPGLTETQARRRDQIVARYRDRISPPLATAAGGGFVVTAHTVRAGTLWHHTLSVTAAGRLSDVADPLADDLPTPHAG